MCLCVYRHMAGYVVHFSLCQLLGLGLIIASICGNTRYFYDHNDINPLAADYA